MNSLELQKLLDQYNKLGSLDSDGMASSLPERSGADFGIPDLNAPEEPKPLEPMRMPAAEAPAVELPVSPPVSPTPSMGSGYGSELDDKALKAAQEGASQQRRLANLAKAGSLFGSAIASKNTKEYINPDTSISDNVIKSSNTGIENLLQRRKSKDDELARSAKVMDLNNEKAMQDPNSPISRALRDSAKMVGLAVPDTLSGAQLKASGLNLGNLLTAHEAGEARKEAARARISDKEAGREEGKRKFAQTEVRSYQKDAEKEVKELRDQAIASKNLVTMTEEAQKNPIAASSIGVMAAKARGERGALSATDVTRYVENKAAAGKVAQWINSAAQGTITPMNAAFIKDVERALQGSYDQRIGESYNRYAERFAQNTGLDIDEARDKLVPQSERKYVDNLTVKVKLPDGRTGTIPRGKLKQAIEQGAQEIQ